MKKIIILHSLIIMALTNHLFSNPTDIAKIEVDGVKWKLIKEGDENGSSVFVYRDDKVVGGDVSPFPLSRWGVESKVATKLADAYVDWEIKSTPGGIDTIKKTTMEREKLPHDLLDAYKKHFTVDIRPVFATHKRELTDMLIALETVKAAKSKAEVDSAVNEFLRPVLPEILITMADQPDKDLGMAIIQSAVVHADQPQIQLCAAVYAGRQPKMFAQASSGLETKDKSSLKQAIEGAIKAKLVGSVVRDQAGQVAASLN